MSIAKLIHGVKSLAYEDDTPTPAPAAKTPTGAPAPHPAFSLPPSFSTGAGTAAAPAFAGGSPFSVPNTTVLDEKVYQSVLAKTNFNTTPVGKAIIRYYDALEGVIADQNARFKAAISQAQKLDSITPDQVLATFDQLSTALNTDSAAFQRVADGVQANQITARQTKITSIQQQVETLNSQIAQLQTELASETANHANAVTQYGLAQSRRAQEIAAQKAQVASLLQ
jgi:hypothetical protein